MHICNLSGHLKGSKDKGCKGKASDACKGSDEGAGGRAEQLSALGIGVVVRPGWKGVTAESKTSCRLAGAVSADLVLSIGGLLDSIVPKSSRNGAAGISSD